MARPGQSNQEGEITVRVSFVVLIVLNLFSQSALAGTLLGDVRLEVLDVTANDIAYDRSRGLLYATVPSSAGLPDGNSIVTLDPRSGARVDSVFAGSEPGRIEVAADGSLAYVGIDGARGFRSWVPGTDSFGPITGLRVFGNDTAVAENFAISPVDPSIVGVARDEIGSSADGDLRFYVNGAAVGPESLTRDANQLAFLDAQTLITYNDSNTGFRLGRWNVEPDLSITLEDSASGLVSGFSTRFELDAGTIFASNGLVADPLTLTALGTFAVGLRDMAVENVDELGLTYFLGTDGSFSGPTTLRVFDSERFLLLDSLEIGGSFGFIRELVEVPGGLAFLSSDGRVGVLSSVPVPEPSTGLLVSLGLVALGRSRRRRPGAGR